MQDGDKDDGHGLYDMRLPVHGIRGLRVADVSITRTIIPGNTNSPTIIILKKTKAAEITRIDRQFDMAAQ